VNANDLSLHLSTGWRSLLVCLEHSIHLKGISNSKLYFCSARKQKFKRVARRKMRPDERIYQCSMVIGIDDHLLVLLTLNRSNGRSRIVVAQPYKNKMSVVGVLRESDLRHLSDIRGFRTADNRRYLVAAQRLKNGQCFVYRGRTIWMQLIGGGRSECNLSGEDDLNATKILELSVDRTVTMFKWLSLIHDRGS